MPDYDLSSRCIIPRHITQCAEVLDALEEAYLLFKNLDTTTLSTEINSRLEKITGIIDGLGALSKVKAVEARWIQHWNKEEA